MINEEIVAWGVSSFDFHKSAVPDGIFPALLQRSSPVIVPWLVVIFGSILGLEYIPKKLREVRVVFIPKTGQMNHNITKDNKSNNLSSFLLKRM